MEYFLAAISLGLLGAFHCIGMCGPIALALPIHQKSHTEKIISILAYNFGRIITYSVFGLIFGLIGQSFFFFGYQQKLSVFLGLVILSSLLFPKRWINKSGVVNKFYNLFVRLKNQIASQFQKKGIKSFLSIGLLNGLLPCGLVYMAIAGAIATGNIYKGIGFMAVFGAGTLPFMFSISYTSHLSNLNTRNRIRKAMPFVIGFMAVLLVLRGLNLGIDYISPKLSDEKNSTSIASEKQIECCHKK